MSVPEDLFSNASTVPRLVPESDPRSASLDARQTLVLSRIDGRASVHEICLMVPFPAAETVAILRRLLALALITARSPERPQRTSRKSATSAPGRSPSRTPTSPSPAVLSSSEGAAGTPSAPAAGIDPTQLTHDQGPRVTRRPAVKRWVAKDINADDRPSFTERYPNTPRATPLAWIDPPITTQPNDGIELPHGIRTRIDEMSVLATKGDPAALLGVPPGADEKTIRQAYFRLAKEFHPDRYYGKQIGPYRVRLEVLFATLSDAFRTLSQSR